MSVTGNPLISIICTQCGEAVARAEKAERERDEAREAVILALREVARLSLRTAEPDAAGLYHDRVHKDASRSRAARTARNKPAEPEPPSIHTPRDVRPSEESMEAEIARLRAEVAAMIRQRADALSEAKGFLRDALDGELQLSSVEMWMEAQGEL